jgi:hypothetical protein
VKKLTAEELQNWKRQFTEAFEQQTATSEILRVISESPTDTQPVFRYHCTKRHALVRCRDGGSSLGMTAS